MAVTPNKHKLGDRVDDPNQTILIVPDDTGTITDYLLPEPSKGLEQPTILISPATPVSPKVPSPKVPAPRIRQLPGCGLNPLVRAANPLLNLVLPLRYLTSHPDVEALRLQLGNAIRQFETDAKAASVALEMIAAARYALCTLLDETISSTPWGGNGVWACNSLLVTFHNEVSGGEKFFVILQRLTQNANKNLDALELMYLCLALGLEGRYAVLEGGQIQLANLRERLQQFIKARRGSFEPDLSRHWKGVTSKRAVLIRQLPIWAATLLVGACLLILQFWFSFSLERQSTPVSARLQRLQLKQPVAAAAVAPPVEAVPVDEVKQVQRVTALLAPDIEQGMVSVSETAESSLITLRGDGVFASGSAEIGESFKALLGRIGDAVQMLPGKVIIIGHTDNTGAGSISTRLAANQKLSEARAQSVATLLAARASGNERSDRFVVKGAGETSPLVPNDTPANRTRNRRVEIVVMTPAP